MAKRRRLYEPDEMDLARAAFERGNLAEAALALEAWLALDNGTGLLDRVDTLEDILQYWWVQLGIDTDPALEDPKLLPDRVTKRKRYKSVEERWHDAAWAGLIERILRKRGQSET